MISMSPLERSIQHGFGYGNKPSKIKTSPHYEAIKLLYEAELAKSNKIKLRFNKTGFTRLLNDKFPDLKVRSHNVKEWIYRYERDKDKKKIEEENEITLYKMLDKVPFKEGINDPIWFAEKVLCLELHEGQKTWLRETCRSDRKKNVLVPANQYGKTMLTAIKHIWICYFKKGLPDEIKDTSNYDTLALSPQLRQIRSFYSYVLQIVQGKFWWTDRKGKIRMNDKCKIKDFLVKPQNVPSTNQISQIPIEWNNGAKIYAVSTGNDLGAGLAGGQFPYISYDECALSNNLEEELSARIRSRLIKFDGMLDLIGTPDDISNSFMFYERVVEKGIRREDGWFTQIGKLDDNYFISEKNRNSFKESLLRDNPDKYRQVVFGEFVKGGSQIFPPRIIKKIWVPYWEMVEEERGMWKGEDYEYGHSYVIGVDWALSIDYTVMVVLDITNDKVWKIVYFYRIKGSDKPPQQQYIDLLNLKNRYMANVMMDTNGLGGKVIESEFGDFEGFEGLNFGPGRKAGFIGTLKKNLFYNQEEGRIRSPYIKALEDELGSYKINDIKLTQDSVMALGLAVWKADRFEELPHSVDFSF